MSELRRCELNGPRSTERLREPRQHRQVSVERDPLQPTDAERGEAVVGLQVGKRPLCRTTATVEVAEPLAVTRDAREQPPAESERQCRLIRLCATERNDRLYAPLLTLLIDAGDVVALVSRDCLRAYGNGQRYVSQGGPERERFSDPDASWGHRSAVSTRKGGGFYGYKLQLAAYAFPGQVPRKRTASRLPLLLPSRLSGLCCELWSKRRMALCF